MKPVPKKRKKQLDPATIVLVRQILVGLFVFACVASLIALVYHGTRADLVTLKTVSVEGGVTISHDEVRRRVEDVLEGAYLKLVPRRFAYMYPDEAVLKEVQAVPRIKDVVIERRSGTELFVSFAEYLPDALLCVVTEGESVPEDIPEKEQCYFVDETGYVFALAPALKGESVVRYYLSDGKVEPQSYAFPTEDYLVTKEFIAALSTIGWYVEKVEVTSARDAFYTLTRGGELKTTITSGFNEPFENLKTILASEEFSGLKTAPFQYLDLRFGTRVFVNEEPLPVAGEGASSTATSTDEGLMEGE